MFYEKKIIYRTAIDYTHLRRCTSCCCCFFSPPSVHRIPLVRLFFLKYVLHLRDDFYLFLYGQFFFSLRFSPFLAGTGWNPSFSLYYIALVGYNIIIIIIIYSCYFHSSCQSRRVELYYIKETLFYPLLLLRPRLKKHDRIALSRVFYKPTPPRQCYVCA